MRKRIPLKWKFLRLSSIYSGQILSKSVCQFWNNKLILLQKIKNSKKLYDPFYGCGSTAATSRRQFTFYHSVLWNSWYSFYRPPKDERLSRPWSHPVVLITGSRDWESSALTTRPLLHKDEVLYIWKWWSKIQLRYGWGAILFKKQKQCALGVFFHWKML